MNFAQKSLLTWHIVLHFDTIYTIFYCAFMIGFHFYKGFGGLAYPPVVWALELFDLICLSIVQLVRIYFGFYSNRTESHRHACIFLLLSILCLVSIVHSSFVTTYVLLIEILFGSIIGALCVLEVLFSLTAFNKFRAIS